MATALSDKLGTDVKVERIDVRLPNRIIVDGLLVKDKQNADMLHAGRVSATVSLMMLAKGEVNIASAQLFGMQTQLYKRTKDGDINCQFVIDSLQSKDHSKPSKLNITIGSLVIRNGAVTYDEWYEPKRKTHFSPHHVSLSGLSAHIILNRLTNDSLDVMLKRLSFDEEAGLQLRDMRGRFILTDKQLTVNDFTLQLPSSNISVPSLTASYVLRNKKIVQGSLRLDATLLSSGININDLAMFLPDGWRDAFTPFSLSAHVNGTDSEMKSNLSMVSTSNNAIDINVNAMARNILSHPSLSLNLQRMHLSDATISSIAELFHLPSAVKSLSDTQIKGSLEATGKTHFATDIDVTSTAIGHVSLNGKRDNSMLTATINDADVDLSKLLPDASVGKIVADGNVKATLADNNKIQSAVAEVNIKSAEYRKYIYNNVSLKGRYDGNKTTADVNVNDENLQLEAHTDIITTGDKRLSVTAKIHDLAPAALGLTHQLQHDRLSLDLNVDLHGLTPDNTRGSIAVRNVSLHDPVGDRGSAYLDAFVVSLLDTDDGQQQLSVQSDFMHVLLSGHISLTTLPQSLTNMVAAYLPAIPGMPATRPNLNDFSFQATVDDLSFLKRITDIPLSISNPIRLQGYVNSPSNMADISLTAGTFNVGGMAFSSATANLSTTSGSLLVDAVTLLQMKESDMFVRLNCEGNDNILCANVRWDNLRNSIFRGQLNTQTVFSPLPNGRSDIEISIPRSSFQIGDTTWNIHSQSIYYKNQRLHIDHLAIENAHQHFFVDGVASKESSDTITADLKNLNLAYILDLVNFHSVTFEGNASGKVMAHSVFGDIDAQAALDVADFRFESGRLGDMHIDATYNNNDKRINIDALAEDKNDGSKLKIDGFISPSPSYLDLQLVADSTRMEFMNSFCGGFLSDIDMHGTGTLHLYGPFSNINLTGKAAVRGAMTLTSTNVRYWLLNDTVTFVPDDIQFNNFHLRDPFDNVATLNGGIHHRHLGNISYDITATADRLLAYNQPVIPDGETYCGYAIINGEVGISGRGNEVNIYADCTPLQGTYFTYNASSPESIKSQDFVTWGSMQHDTIAPTDKPPLNNDVVKPADDVSLNTGNDRANIRMNFQINATPEARLHLIMDDITGDYIDLFGNGALRVQYYNKGSLDIFGNYIIDHGTYKMTIQNLLRRDFSFTSGGTIAFGGDPYNATINMQAAYELKSVSLADLNIGSSFKSNNVPVSCLMNITGTPEAPAVAFNLDLPSLSSDARQMVQSVINSEEEMNQQVLYLLAVGRFYSQTNDNNATQRTAQSTLAMQSFLSGTLSEQLSNVLSQVIKNNNWSVGANITPGSDGFNMGAEYEGLLSGRMFNNRLLFDGQFGYRDNINTNTQSFIGDFSIQYLLTPNGSLSAKVYNQSNDRYFTPSSLNTQGIGIVVEKEFNTIGELLRFRSRSTKKSNKSK